MFTQISKNNSLTCAFSVLLIVIATLIVAGCGSVYGHEEFEKMVKNKSEDEVVKALGKPASVDSANPAQVVWTYNQVTYDIDNHNNRDAKTMLVLTPIGGTGKLQVTEVTYTR